jgi:K+-sensing histidine kinase KdpD
VTRTWRLPLGAEVTLAFATAAGFFALVAVLLSATESDAVAIALGVVAVAAVVGIALLWGVSYAAPGAMAGLLAYDWYQFPPTHPREFPDSANLVDLLAYLGVAVLIGELAALAGHRAAASELARGGLAEEQGALRRVATLVASGAQPDEVFGAVAEEVGPLLGAHRSASSVTTTRRRPASGRARVPRSSSTASPGARWSYGALSALLSQPQPRPASEISRS